jgi:hypothetical protein
MQPSDYVACGLEVPQALLRGRFRDARISHLAEPLATGVGKS